MAISEKEISDIVTGIMKAARPHLKGVSPEDMEYIKGKVEWETREWAKGADDRFAIPEDTIYRNQIEPILDRLYDEEMGYE